jgi:hypothetical protein
MPNSALEAIDSWAKAYASYAQSAIAGGTVPIALAPVAVQGPFFEALDQTLKAMWMASAWIGPGLTGVVSAVPVLSPVLRVVGTSQLKNRDPEAALSEIADALHTYTLGVAVTITTAAGVSSVVPLR